MITYTGVTAALALGLLFLLGRNEQKLVMPGGRQYGLYLLQPRVSDLKRGKVDKFTIDMLVNFLTKLGHNVTVRVA